MIRPYAVLLLGIAIFLTLLLPGILLRTDYPPSLPKSTEALKMLIQQLPLLVLLLWMTLGKGALERLAHGWNAIKRSDVLGIVVLLLVSTGVGLIVPSQYFLPKNRIPDAVDIVSLMGLSVVMACIEELFFRSWILTQCIDAGWRRWQAILLSCLAFAVIHFQQGWYGILYAACIGVLYAIFFLRRRNIPVLLFSHGLHNVLAIFLLSIG